MCMFCFALLPKQLVEQLPMSNLEGGVVTEQTDAKRIEHIDGKCKQCQATDPLPRSI